MAKSPKQLDAEIAHALAKPAAMAAIATPKRLAMAQIKKLRIELRKAIKNEKAEAAYRGRNMKIADYERAADDAIRAAGIRGQAAAQGSDDGVEIWEIIPGVGPIDDQIAGYSVFDDE